MLNYEGNDIDNKCYDDDNTSNKRNHSKYLY